MSGALWLHTVLWCVGLLLLIAVVTVIGVWWERKFIGHLQRRRGPLHTGFHGLLQLPADMVKMLGKEDIVPDSADPWLFQLGPILAVVPAIAAMAALTFAPRFALLDMDHGLFYIFAFQTLMPLAFAVIGWSCANKFTLIGALRSAAQLISYEIPMLLAALGVVVTSGSMRLTDIINAQVGTWYVFKQPIGFAIFFVAILAEMNRTPFDLPEAESELVAGYQTEYSGMKFGFVQLAEYAALFTGSYLVSALFLGGWNMPLLPASPLWLVLKIVAVMTSTMWIRGTFPRLRIDSLMALAWKWTIPIALANIMVVSALALLLPDIY
ncbi:MAG TPA: NADH-quinone oxidoreductase subunit NuoH [Coriobacteriia bacterium]